MVFTAATIAAIAKKFTSPMWAFLAFIAVLTWPAVGYNYGVMLHPDTTQMFFITWSLLAAINAIQKNNFWWLSAGFCSAGLAFSTKYAGVALIPLLCVVAGVIIFNRYKQLKNYIIKKQLIVFIGLPLCLLAAYFADANYALKVSTLQSKTEHIMFPALQVVRVMAIVTGLLFLFYLLPKIYQNKIYQRVISFIFWCLIGCWVFVLSFLLGSPQFFEIEKFIEGFIFVTGLHKNGHWFMDHTGWHGWLNILLSVGGLGKIFGVLSLILNVGLVVWLFSKKQKNSIENLITFI